MAKFYIELVYDGAVQARYLVKNGGINTWLNWENINDSVDFVCVNSQHHNKIIEELYGQDVAEFMEKKGLTQVRINMVRYDEGAMSLSGRYSIYRRWDVKSLVKNTPVRWVPIFH